MNLYCKSCNGYQWHSPASPINGSNHHSIYNWYPHQYNWNHNEHAADRLIQLKDYGPNPFVVNIDQASEQNRNYRTVLWTGKHLQVALMSINVGDDIGLEVHPNTDQFIRIEEGEGLVRMGDRKDNLTIEQRVDDDYAILVPAGTWHNVINTGNKPLKVYTIYAPPEHPFGTVHETKAIAMASE
nr:cupin domain-containing protein [Paenibacillus agilis]